MNRPNHPYLSVIVPVHQGTKVLPKSLGALSASDLPRESWELIVVDDASTDTTAALAAAYADAVVRLPGAPHGPAYARNRGVEVARGEVVVFIDADVCVHPDTLRRFAATFASEPDVSAVFGSYDDRPPAKGFVSQYRNLLHHYVHHRAPGEADTFWAGCGAVRRQIFVEAGMYDEWHFSRPQIEDIELGHRIRAQGHRIILRPDIQGTHLKRWTLRSVLLTDVSDRGVPWMRLLIHEDSAVRTRALNLRTIEKVNTALIWLALALSALAIWQRDRGWLAGVLCCLGAVVFVNRALYAFFERQRGLLFALGVIPLHMMYYVTNGVSAMIASVLHHTVGAPAPAPIVQAFAEVGLETWPPVPSKRARDA